MFQKSSQLLHNIDQFHIKGQTSIQQYLPSPTIHTTDTHAYISLISVIDPFLALEFQPYYITSINGVFKMHGIATGAHIQVVRQQGHITAPGNAVHMIACYLSVW